MLNLSLKAFHYLTPVYLQVNDIVKAFTRHYQMNLLNDFYEEDIFEYGNYTKAKLPSLQSGKKIHEEKIVS